MFPFWYNMTQLVENLFQMASRQTNIHSHEEIQIFRETSFVISHVVLVVSNKRLANLFTHMASISWEISMFGLNVAENEIFSGMLIVTVSTFPSTAIVRLSPEHPSFNFWNKAYMGKIFIIYL